MKEKYSNEIKVLKSKIKSKLDENSNLTEGDLLELFHYYDLLDYYDYYENEDYYKNQIRAWKDEFAKEA